MPATALKPQHEEMLRLRESGLSAAQIARELGVAENSVFVALKRLRNQGVEVPVSTAPVGLRGPSIAIPAWVPKSLHADYRKVAAERGEEEAASWVRRTKNGEPVALCDLAAATTRAKPQVRKPYGSATTSTQQASAKAGFT